MKSSTARESCTLTQRAWCAAVTMLRMTWKWRSSGACSLASPTPTTRASSRKRKSKNDGDGRRLPWQRRTRQLTRRAGWYPAWVLRLPAVNASLNGLATVLLVAGWTLIKSRKPQAHKIVMLTAFAVSAAFLACYLVYHFQLHHYTGSGSQKFQGTGAVRLVYFPLLISHIVLAVAVAVLAPTTIYRGLANQLERHKRLARITFPIWLYVSVTGVIIYFMLYHWPVQPG